MNNNLIKIALGMILAVGSAKAAETRTFVGGYYFQHVSKITGNLTSTADNGGNMAGKITVINTDQRWTSDTIYILDNLTFVEPPATLTIEAGTIVRGAPLLYAGTSTLDPTVIGDLNICRGANIVAKGTAAAPIIMTSFYDSLVPGGLATVPHDIVNKDGDVVPVSNATRTSEALKYSGANSTSGSFAAHKIDGEWGSLTLLGRASVGFGGPTGSAGNLLVAISDSNKASQAYTDNPTFTFTPVAPDTRSYSAGSSGFNLEAIFNPVPVAEVYKVGTTGGGKFTGAKPTFEAIAAAGSRTATKTTLKNIVVAYNRGPNGNYDGVGGTLADYSDSTSTGVHTGANPSDDYWEITSVAINNAGLQYNVPTQKDSDPFFTVNGFSGAQIAFKYTHGGGGYLTVSTTAPGAAVGGTICTVLPSFKMRLAPTYLYGVIVKAPNKYGALTGTAPTLAVSGGNSTTHAVAVCSISATPVTDPEAIPLKGGIAASFIEGKQAIDGSNYGVASAPTVDAAGISWTKLSGGIFGGTDNNDNSGTLHFVQLRHGGMVLSPNNEINGLTLGGVGRGTSIEYVEVFNNADDDFEMFGGCVDLKHVAAMFGGDDCFDTDMSYRGKGQYLFACQNNTVGSTRAKATGRPTGNVGDNLGENDGNEDPNFIVNSFYPGTDFCYFNTTMIGIGYIMPDTLTSFPSDRQGPNMKDNSGGKVFNSIYVEAPSGAMCDQSTVAATDDVNGVGARKIVTAPFGNTVVTAGGTSIEEPQGVLAFNTWAKCGGGRSFTAPAIAGYTDTSVGGALFPQKSGRTSGGGGVANHSIAVVKTLVTDLSNRFTGDNVLNSTGTNGRLAGVDPTLPLLSAERSNGTNPRASRVVAPGETTGLQSSLADRGTFYAPTSFRGAFKDFNWMKGWTHSDELGVFANNSVVAPDVTLTRDGSGNVIANFTGASGIQYIIETSSDNKTFVPLNDATIVGSDAPIAKNLGVGGLLFVRVNPQ